jgi:hypothetical protein
VFAFDEEITISEMVAQNLGIVILTDLPVLRNCLSSKAFAVSLAILVPASDFLIEPSIISVVSIAALAERAARFLTSSATTAKPLPCCPALATSTAAFPENNKRGIDFSKPMPLMFISC